MQGGVEGEILVVFLPQPSTEVTKKTASGERERAEYVKREKGAGEVQREAEKGFKQGTFSGSFRSLKAICKKF